MFVALHLQYMTIPLKCNHPTSVPIHGLPTTSAITRQQAEDWFNKYYHAKNLTVAIVGDVDSAQALEMISCRSSCRCFR